MFVRHIEFAMHTFSSDAGSRRLRGPPKHSTRRAHLRPLGRPTTQNLLEPLAGTVANGVPRRKATELAAGVISSRHLEPSIGWAQARIIHPKAF